MTTKLPQAKRIAKWALGLLGTLVAIFLVAPAFLPRSVHVERSLQINKNPDEVFAVISDLRQYPSWDPFSDEDPTLQAKVTGSGPDAVYEWQGEQAGQGRLTIEKLDSPRSVQMKLQMVQPMEDESYASWQLEPHANGTRITWTLDQELPYFLRWVGLGMDGMLGPAFEKGLTKLKTNLES
jgi:carbon monoxide dehydrogenase subunit G